MQMGSKIKLEQQSPYQTKQTLKKIKRDNDQGINPRGRHNNCKIYASNIGAPQYIRQKLTNINGEIDSNTIIVGDSNTPLTPMDRSSKQKINKETQVLNDTQMRWISLISSGHFIQMQKNTSCFQVHMEHSPGQTTSWVTNQASVSFRKLKQYQASSPSTTL